MKKLISFLLLFILGDGMSLLGQVSPRANVPYDQSTWNISWDWTDYYQTLGFGKLNNYNWYYLRLNDGTDQFNLLISFSKTSSMRDITIGGTTHQFPVNGTYTISTSSSKQSGRIYGGSTGTSVGTYGYNTSDLTINGYYGYFGSGTMKISDGANGLPFVEIETVIKVSGYNDFNAYFSIGLPPAENLSDSWTNNELITSSTTLDWGSNSEVIRRLEWYRDGVIGRKPCVRLECDMFTNTAQYYNSYMLPENETYTFNTNGSAINSYDLLSYPINDGSNYIYSMYYPSDGTKRYLKGGTARVVKGINGPCIKINATGSKYPKFSNSTYTLTIGTPAYTITFNNYDGTQLQSSDWAENAMPSYSGSTPSKPDDASYTYTFTGWSPSITTATADKTYTAQFSASQKIVNHTVTISDYSNGTVTISYSSNSFSSGSMDIEDGTSITIVAIPATGYELTYLDYSGESFESGNQVTLDGNKTITAVFSPITYNINYEKLYGITNDNPNTYTIETPDITLVNPGDRSGYIFTGWTNNDGDAVTQIVLGSIGDTTIIANWEEDTPSYNITYNGVIKGFSTENPSTYKSNETVALSDAIDTYGVYSFTCWTNNNKDTITEICEGSEGDTIITANWQITLRENAENSYYDNFKEHYNGDKAVVILNRQFGEGRWSTFTLPFNVNGALLSTNSLRGRVYEFKYATGNADTNPDGSDGPGVTLYFSQANKMEAGKCYIVNANKKLSEKETFIFPNVTIDLEKDKGTELSGEDSYLLYDELEGFKSKNDISLVGTLRNGVLKGGGKKYMGLKDNKIYYPNLSVGSRIYAYRGVFRFDDDKIPSVSVRLRIVTDDGIATELEVIDNKNVSKKETQKFIKDGLMYIEKDGKVYNIFGNIDKK